MSGQAWRGRPPLSEQFPEIRTPWKAIAAEARYAAEHDMQPGEPFPSLAAMAEMYEVTRSTAGKALRALAAEGLAELEPGVGYFVPRASEVRG